MQVDVFVQLVIHLQLLRHAHEDDAVGVRLQRTPDQIVDSQRRVVPDLGQQLLGSKSWIDVEFAIEEFVIDAF